MCQSNQRPVDGVIGVAMGLGRSTGSATRLRALALPRWRVAAMHSEPDASVSELARWVGQLNGTEIRGGAAATPVDADRGA